MYSAIETAIADSNPRNTPRDQRGDMVGGIVRLSFHDAGEFDRTAADALGPDGCVDLTKGDNAGLAAVITDLDRIWGPFCDIISKADFWVLAAKVSVEVTAVVAYEVPFRYGRATAAECGYAGDRLPAAEGGVEEIERVFVTAMGLTFRDAVALLGAHTLGRLETENSGFEGAWTTTPDTFDNDYFVTLTQNGWDLAVLDDAHTTWVRGGTMFLNADMELAYHVADEADNLNRCGPVGMGGGRNGNGRCLDNTVVNSHAIEFGNSETAWLAAFATAFQGMTEVGFAEGDLCDPADASTCGGPDPGPTTAAPTATTGDETYCPAGYTDLPERFNQGLGRITVVSTHQQCADRCTQFSAPQFNGGCKAYMTGMYIGMLYCRSYGGDVRTGACASWATSAHPGFFSGQIGSVHPNTNQENIGGNCCTRITAL